MLRKEEKIAASWRGHTNKLERKEGEKGARGTSLSKDRTAAEKKKRTVDAATSVNNSYNMMIKPDAYPKHGTKHVRIRVWKKGY
jgi:hypothetical protein